MDMLIMWYEQLAIGAWLERDGLPTLITIFTGILLFYTGSMLLERFVKQAVKNTAKHRAWHRKDMQKRQDTLAGLFRNVWRIIVIAGVFIALFRTLVDDADEILAPLFASAGIIGVALGFGAQSVIKDFLSGIFIIAENQFRVGDIVDIEGATGTVERIGTRSTVIRDVDGNVHYFPNGMVMHVINKTMGYSMARFSIAIEPNSNIPDVIKIINTIGLDLAAEDEWQDRIIEAPAFVMMGEFTGLSVDLIIAGKTQPSDQWAVTAEMRRRLLEALELANVELAIPPNVMARMRQK